MLLQYSFVLRITDKLSFIINERCLNSAEIVVPNKLSNLFKKKKENEMSGFIQILKVPYFSFT